MTEVIAPSPVDGRAAANALHHAPLWRAEDLGRPLPDSPHAVSVALPLWQHVVGYEERDPAVTQALHAGYPRFVLHRFVAELFRTCESRYAAEGECCFAFPSRKIAERCAAWLQRRAGVEARVRRFEDSTIYAVVLPQTAFDSAKRFWQHFGEIVSSRQAEAVLAGRSCPPAPEAEAALKARLASWAGARPEDAFLYPSGIAALAEAHRAIQAHGPNLKSVQVGFPYVDVLKIQTETDPGVFFFPQAEAEHVASVRALVEREKVSGILCEFAGNPLLTSVDVRPLSEIAREQRLPFVIDETLGSYANVDLLPHADALVTSLTKYVSGVSDVMGGALILNPDSPFYSYYREYMQERHEALLWPEDLTLLELYSRDYPERLARINRTAETLCDWLQDHPKVARVYYPKFTTSAAYESVRRPEGGYGGLFSVLLRDPAETATPFYDRLRVSKGPSLGTNFTLACPYTLLAHYDELDAVEAQGVSRWLIRVSVGLECAEDLIARFEEALREA